MPLILLVLLLVILFAGGVGSGLAVGGNLLWIVLVALVICAAFGGLGRGRWY